MCPTLAIVVVHAHIHSLGVCYEYINKDLFDICHRCNAFNRNKAAVNLQFPWKLSYFLPRMQFYELVVTHPFL